MTADDVLAWKKRIERSLSEIRVVASLEIIHGFDRSRTLDAIEALRAALAQYDSYLSKKGAT